MILELQHTPNSILGELKGKTEIEALRWLAEVFSGKVVFSSSLGAEDQVIIDMIFRNKLNISIFTLDTGRLFEETQKVLQKTNKHYETKLQVFFPNTEAVQNLVNTKGPYSFYESVQNRKECCFIRKVEPLNRALIGAKVWVTGIRAEQSGNRLQMPQLEWDEAHQVYKFHPLINWTLEEVQTYIKDKNIPYNSLHDKGFVSIGCAPCTRAVRPGEDFRAGRWWWEDESKKECGLHQNI